MSILAQVAGAVVAVINGSSHTLGGQPVEAVRMYRPSYKLEQLKHARIAVVPETRQVEVLYRNRDAEHTVMVSIGVQKRVPTEETGDVDPLIELTEQLEYELINARMPAGISLLKIENRPIYSEEHLKRFNVYTSVLLATYTLEREGSHA